MNIFSVLQANYEIFHSRMLAWLLTPNESHGSGDRFLRVFFRLINAEALETEISTEVKISVPETARWRLADVVLKTAREFILVENKVDPAYQDPKQIEDELSGGRELARAEGREFRFVLLAPGPLSDELHQLIESSNQQFLSWDQLLRQLRSVSTEDLRPDIASILEEYFTFCDQQFVAKGGATSPHGGPSGDSAILRLGAEAMCEQLAEITVGTAVTAPELWPVFCSRYPDHLSQLEARWADSSNYSAKAWFATRLQQFAAKRYLLEETGEWIGTPEWSFPRVRVYRRISDEDG